MLHSVRIQCAAVLSEERMGHKSSVAARTCRILGRHVIHFIEVLRVSCRVWKRNMFCHDEGSRSHSQRP